MEKQKDYSMKFNGSKFDCNQLFQKGLYYLYKNNKIVYIGMSSSNVMDRILKHYNEKLKDFDSYTIILKPNASDKELLLLEKNAIKKHLPNYNIVHKTQKQTDIDYEFAKELKNKCYHSFVSLKDNDSLICSKCGFKLSKKQLQPKEKEISKTQQRKENKAKKEVKERRRIIKNIESRTQSEAM